MKVGEVMKANKVPGGMRMWRAWKLTDKNELKALISDHIWKPGVNTVTSDIRNGAGGFYGFDDVRRIAEQERDLWQCFMDASMLQDSSPVAIGSIIGWGITLIGPFGARIQYAQPEYLVLAPDIENNMDYNLRLLETAQRYGMRPVTLEQIKGVRAGCLPFSKDMIKKGENI